MCKERDDQVIGVVVETLHIILTAPVLRILSTALELADIHLHRSVSVAMPISLETNALNEPHRHLD